MKNFILNLVFLFLLSSVIIIACKKEKPAPQKNPPLCTTNTSPLNNTNVSSASVTLTWAPVSAATSYDVYVGTSAANTSVVASNVSGNSYNYTIPSTTNATYYWYVVPKNADGAATGCNAAITSFVFGTAPGCATNIEPANSSNITTKTVTLKWSKVPNSIGYDVYIGTSSTTTTVVASNVTDTLFNYTIPANFSTTFYWYVVPKNNNGSGGGCTTSITAFTYLTTPTTTTNLSPGSGSLVYGTTAELKWNKVVGAANYDVYVGTSAATATIVGSNVSDTLYSYTLPTVPLSITYYWYVVPKNILGNAVNAQATATNFRHTIIKTPAALNFPVVGYTRTDATEYDNMWKMMDVVAFAFGNINTSGTVTIASTNIPKLNNVVSKANAAGSKVVLAISGASADFKTMAGTATGRNNFVKDLMNKVRQYNLDGIDMDWEYPSTANNGHLDYEAMMKELSDSLHVDGKYYLTAAVTSGKYAGSYRDAITDNVIRAVDLLNIMIYDDFAVTDSTERFRHHADMKFFDVCLNYWRGRFNTAGVSMKKCVLGMPVYGHPSWEPRNTSTTLSYKTITVKGVSAGPASVYDSDSAWVNNGGIYTNFKIYYNGRPTVKAKTAKAYTDAGGIMFWELGHDKNDEYSLIKAACDQLGRTF